MDGKVSYLWKEPAATSPYKVAVSLHGHTNHSKESLRFISDYAQNVPVLRWALAWEKRRARRVGGIGVDFDHAYWLPPLSPRMAYDVESQDIARTLNLASFVSLTDHDNVEAPLLLRMLPDTAQIPISLEWTVPHDGTELHLGIHNLPPKCAHSMVSGLNNYTARPGAAALRELLVALHRMREVLIVLNHPFWDLSSVGEAQHRRAVSSFMAGFGQSIHALELSGLRGWEENKKTADFAGGWNVPAIAGGDRHGYEPSACLNLTNAASFAEFADEVRHGQSHVLFMPQYAEPLWIRMIRVVNDAVRSYPNSPLGADWDDRVYHPDREGRERPISELWNSPPVYIEAALSIFWLLESTPMQRLAQSFSRSEQQPYLSRTGEASL